MFFERDKEMKGKIIILVFVLALSGVAQAQTTYIVFVEDFESLTLGPSPEEAPGTQGVWTDTPPPGWSIDDSGVPGVGNPATDGVTDWAGWAFTDKEWWTSEAGDQRRSEYTLGKGSVAVADPDEWDDSSHASGSYNAYLSTPAIDISRSKAGTLELQFDSSWRPEVRQTGNITVSYDGGSADEVLRWESQAGAYYKDHSTNETIVVDLDNPPGARSMVLTFGLFDAGNNWWWAIDNIVVTAAPRLEVVYNPNPPNRATDLLLSNVVLSWTPGEFVGGLSPKHKVILSDNFNDVKNGTAVVATQDSNSYDPAGLLDFSTTYYWRIDKANSTTGWDQGVVWQFTVASDDTDVGSYVTDVGPYVQFTGPFTAVVRWDTSDACDSIVEYGTTELMGLRVEDYSTATTHEITLSNLQYRTRYYYRVGYSSGAAEVFTENYTFDNAINYTRLDCSNVASPYPVDSLSPLYETAAEHIINQTGIEKGFCLVYGCGEGRLAFELAKRSDLVIVGVDTNSASISTAINKLMEAGVYGARIKAREVTSLENLQFSKYFFNLIVSDHILSEGACAGSAAEMFRVLRPSGGGVYFGQPAGCPKELTEAELGAWLNAGGLTYTTTNDSNGLWSKVVRDPLPGAAEWSRQYGNPDNAANPGDTLEGATQTGHLMIQWIGSPGADFGADRNPRMPTPVMANGRLYHQGLNRILAMDSYNGAIYWSLEVPKSLRVNMPRDNGYLCADADGLYVAVDDDCWFLDGDTGTRITTYKLNDDGLEWGYAGISGDNLYGSAQLDGAHYTNIWGGSGTGWYDSTSGNVTYKVCSKYVFANDKSTGSRVWTDDRPERGAIINSTITIGGGRVYFVESRNAAVKEYPSGQIGISELWTDQYIVALEQNTGAKLWEKAIDTADGIVVFYMQYKNEKLFIASSDTRYNIYAYRATNGNSLWSQNHPWTRDNHSGHMQHPVIAGNGIYLEPNGYDLDTGNLITTRMGRHAGCATYAGTTGALIYRGSGGNIAMWDINSEVVTTWSGIRPSCWLSTIPGGGMVLSPEGSGGCSCNGWLNTSVGFVRNKPVSTPRQRNSIMVRQAHHPERSRRKEQ